MKKNKAIQKGSETLAQIFQLLHNIQREELEMLDKSASFAELNFLYQELNLLKSKLASECGFEQSVVLLGEAKTHAILRGRKA